MVCRDDVSLVGRQCNLEYLICKRFREDGDWTTIAKVYRRSLTSFSASSWMTSPSGLHACSLLAALRKGCTSPCCRLKNTTHAAGSMWQTVRSSREVGHELAGKNLASSVLHDPRDCFGEFGAPLMAGSGKPAPTPSLLGLARKLWRLGGCCIFKSRCKRGKKERDRERERERERKQDKDRRRGTSDTSGRGQFSSSFMQDLWWMRM